MVHKVQIYSKKASKYARYRWEYAPAAIDVLCQQAQLSNHSWVADLGAGTGILTRALAPRVERIFAIEPDPEMLREAEDGLLGATNCVLIAASAEATTLTDHSVDAVVVAQAIHWFDPESTRRELGRILKPGGWLALLRNYGTDPKLGRAMADLNSPDYGASDSPLTPPDSPPPPDYYFGSGHFEKRTFPFTCEQNWKSFLGALTSASFMPDEDHPLFYRLECAARQIFDHFGNAGSLTIVGETELILGQPKY
jgi:SAM-dependent methyltransferase